MISIRLATCDFKSCSLFFKYLAMLHQLIKKIILTARRHPYPSLFKGREHRKLSTNQATARSTCNRLNDILSLRDLAFLNKVRRRHLALRDFRGSIKNITNSLLSLFNEWCGEIDGSRARKSRQRKETENSKQPFRPFWIRRRLILIPPDNADCYDPLLLSVFFLQVGKSRAN